MAEAGDTAAAAGGGPPAAALSVIDAQIQKTDDRLDKVDQAIEAIYIARQATPPVVLPKYESKEEQNEALREQKAHKERLLGILKDLTSQRAQAQAQAGAVQAGVGAGSGAGGASAAGIGHAADRSGDLVEALMRGLGQLDPPKNEFDVEKLLTGRANLKIPVPIKVFESMRDHLDPASLQLLTPVAGVHEATTTFGLLLTRRPKQFGSELTSSIAVAIFLTEVFDTLRQYSSTEFVHQVHLNRTEIGAGSISGAVPVALRPDALVISKLATLMLEEDKLPNKEKEALDDLVAYCKAGLNVHHYGATIPGLLGCCASGFMINFYFISRKGKVATAAGPMDVDTLKGRLALICTLIQCYRLLAWMSQQLPGLAGRTPLGRVDARGEYTLIQLNFDGASKSIPRFKPFARAAGNDDKVLTKAYAAAYTARLEQEKQLKRPFLVSATSKEPSFTRNGFTVQTTPLGYMSTACSEEEIRDLAQACLQAAQVLHAEDIAHSDFRDANVVRLDERSWMVIDLEHCRLLDTVVTCDLLKAWVPGTLEEGSIYSARSDLFLIGCMLDPMVRNLEPACAGATNLVESLKMKNFPTAAAALNHAWLKPSG